MSSVARSSDRPGRPAVFPMPLRVDAHHALPRAVPPSGRDCARHAGPQPRRTLPTSRIRAAGAQAADGVIHLGLGEPTWPLPKPAIRALGRVRACPYGAHAGTLPLRRAIAAYEGVDAAEVLVTAGAQGALFSLLQAFVGPGDSVLIPDPGFPAYRTLAGWAGAETQTYPLVSNAEGGLGRWHLDAEGLVEALVSSPRVRVVIINLPSNPTGSSASVQQLAQVADACAERGVLLVADEVYRPLSSSVPVPGLRAVTDTGVVVSSVSKAWAAPGLRVGWMTGPSNVLEACTPLHATATTAAAGPSQAAARALLEASDRVLPASRAALASRWQALADTWQAETGAVLDPPDGGFYHYFPLPPSAWNDPVAFCASLRDRAKVVVVPGLVFGEGGRRFARLSFGARPDAIVQGVRRLIRAGGVAR